MHFETCSTPDCERDAMNAERILSGLLYLAAMTAVVLSVLTVITHAEGVAAVEGVALELVEVRLENTDVGGTSPGPTVSLSAWNENGHQYSIATIRLVLRCNDVIAATRTSWPLDLEIPADGPIVFDLPLEAGTAFQDLALFQQALQDESAEWVVSGELSVEIPRKHTHVRMHFESSREGAR